MIYRAVVAHIPSAAQENATTGRTSSRANRPVGRIKYSPQRIAATYITNPYFLIKMGKDPQHRDKDPGSLVKDPDF